MGSVGEVETVEGGEVETVEGGEVETVEGGKVGTVNMGGERVDVNEVGRKRRREVEVMRRKAEAEKMSVRRLGRCIVEDLQKTYGGQSMKRNEGANSLESSNTLSELALSCMAKP